MSTPSHLAQVTPLFPAALAALGLVLVWLALWAAHRLRDAPPPGGRPFETP